MCPVCAYIHLNNYIHINIYLFICIYDICKYSLDFDCYFVADPAFTQCR